jgi:XTP/dITP diphosphohydrolase
MRDPSFVGMTTLHIIFATHNPHKTREVQEILGSGFNIRDLTEQPDIPVTIESGDTFEQNAVLKAEETSNYFEDLVLADDSGLEVDALDGAPGIRSARYAGDKATDEENRQKLLTELARARARGKERTARFVCAMALAKRGKLIATFRGAVEGIVINQPKGEHGFGYDPLFVPEGFCETFAQLPSEVKNRISHRSMAADKVRDYLLTLEKA